MPVVAASPSAGVKQHENAISGTSGHQSSTLMTPVDLQSMTSYWCSSDLRSTEGGAAKRHGHNSDIS